ncbi:MAG: tetratricopeptide repeat protein, partial [Bacteroidota bacterium]
MKHFTKTLALLLLSLLLADAVPAQSMLKKANKEFELYAFNLAIKSYRKVLEKDPNNTEALSRLADCYRHLNEMEEAATWYLRALDREGVDPVNLFYYGQVLKAQGKYAEAKGFFEIYAEGQPYFGEHYAASCDFAESMLGVPSLYRVKREFINTESAEFGPTFYGDRLVYSSARGDLARADQGKGETWTGTAKNQLLISGRDNNGFLTPPNFLRSDLANTYNEGPLSYSADGTTVAYTKNDFVDGTRQIPTSGMELSIYLAKVGPDGDFYEAKAFPYNGSGYSSGYPSLSADGKTMYFASNRPDGLGGWDLYVSRRIGDTWTTPENLGAVVNTPGNELSPCFNGSSLYFSSDWHHGMGGLDIFRAERSQQEWTKVYHLGNGINSPRDDFGFVFKASQNLGYFSSNRPGGKGNEDLYQVTKRTDQITISVRDAANRPIAGANVDFSACNEPVFQTDPNGNYQFQALGGLDCEAVISKVGFNSYALQVESTGARQSQTYEVVLT